MKEASQDMTFKLQLHFSVVHNAFTFDSIQRARDGVRNSQLSSTSARKHARVEVHVADDLHCVLKVALDFIQYILCT